MASAASTFPKRFCTQIPWKTDPDEWLGTVDERIKAELEGMEIDKKDVVTLQEEWLKNSSSAIKIDNVLDDNFGDIGGKMTQPALESSVKAKVASFPEEEVTLWRATTKVRVDDMLTYGCAKGSTRTLDTTAPSEQEAKSQAQKAIGLPEFTTDTRLSFSFRHFVVVVKIQAKYLTKGSVVEGGWVAKYTAPVRVIEVCDRTLRHDEPKGFNAA